MIAVHVGKGAGITLHGGLNHFCQNGHNTTFERVELTDSPKLLAEVMNHTLTLIDKNTTHDYDLTDHTADSDTNSNHERVHVHDRSQVRLECLNATCTFEPSIVLTHMAHLRVSQGAFDSLKEILQSAVNTVDLASMTYSSEVLVKVTTSRTVCRETERNLNEN